MLFWLGLTILIAAIALACEIAIGSRKISRLVDISPIPDAEAPSVSIVVAARNEERNIRVALQSLLNLDYPHLQLIVVNDRSEDHTATILDEMAAVNTTLEVVQIQTLPGGWLGKNYALWQGAQRASGELLLFTDADVVMAPGTLKRAVNYLQQNNIDHLAATPEARMPSLSLNMFAVTFGLFFSIFTKPWQADNPNSRCHIGIGAFNLVRVDAYRKVGGHKTIALRPDDDLKLGKIIKNAGFRQRLVYASELITVEWYASIRELILGLEKNIFAGTDYRLWLAIAGVLFNIIAILWPYLALLVTEGTTRLIYLAIVAVISLVVADSARAHSFSPWYALGFPLSTALFTFIIVRTLICNLSQGGITWRGTFYSLEELRRNQV
jgi:glycosyltransferase involved in cell wall biosynthesis